MAIEAHESQLSDAPLSITTTSLVLKKNGLLFHQLIESNF
jgi:hypothetical protein